MKCPLLELYDVVCLRVARDGVDTDTLGTLVLAYESDPPEYEVEFCDADGVTIALLTLPGDALVRRSVRENPS
ncbi:DUF4926 domain-containing protein [Haliangium ochraceum]|uniref:DUF4926 domain-containing protein n=1 Tax=Haliangium ochraceum (strain DSM 14365 / JCM 11303 / SMP-2) TaxID=502025 RepID=D0LN92_HALO1|nr:DUF4926 domain-containing protein [Haliangium ochraceum]ACY15269.1 hypothetical protein Hoch_2740 [Haliangium ochraceum DSM 14365]